MSAEDPVSPPPPDAQGVDGAAESGSCELSSYAELASIVENLPILVRETRRVRRQSMREAARRTGLTASMFSRLESGEHTIHATALLALLHWMHQPTEESADV